jgi:hypothetical protein
MTPGDFASLLEGMEGLTTEDYIAWKLPYVFNETIDERLLTNLTVKKKIQKNSPFPLL